MGENPLGAFEQVVLLAVLRIGEEAYGPAIHAEILRCTGRDVARGALYVTLDRLESKGWIASRAGSPTPQRGGRARRLVRVTAPGLQALRESRAGLLRLWRGLETSLDGG